MVDILTFEEVTVRTPRREEYALLTSLRNRNRHWFGDQRELEDEAAAAWLAKRSEQDQLLCIDCDGVVVGTVGWTLVSTSEHAYELGRTILDYQVARKDRCARRRLKRAVRIALMLSLDHLFNDLGADVVYARIRRDNGLVRNLIREAYPDEVRWPYAESGEQLECWRVTAASWPVNRHRFSFGLSLRNGA